MKLIERTDRVVTRMYGRDPVRMIQGLITNDVANAPVDAPVYAAFLTPKGRMIGDARVIRRDNNDVWIETAAAAMENIEANLKQTVPPLFARAERLQDARVIGVYGDGAESVEIPGALRLATSYLREPGFDFIVRGDVQLPDVDRMSLDEFEVLRIEAGSPKWGAELSEDVIPLEAGLRQAAISETKGCYTGQEIIIRILHRGHVNRHLRGLLLGDAPVPAAAAEVLRGSDQKVVGKITSACASPLLQQTIAMAYIRREVEPGASVVVGGCNAEVIELPFYKQNHEGISRIRSA